MADPRNATGGGRHLDATGEREVVYCHQCENEWYQDEHGLVCPACEGEIIEIVSLQLSAALRLMSFLIISLGRSK